MNTASSSNDSDKDDNDNGNGNHFNSDNHVSNDGNSSDNAKHNDNDNDDNGNGNGNGIDPRGPRLSYEFPRSFRRFRVFLRSMEVKGVAGRSGKGPKFLNARVS